MPSQGGTLVGAPLAGQRVLIVDDVITAGTAVREAVAIITAAGATLAGVVVALDRQERTGPGASAAEDEAASPSSAVQAVEAEFGVPVVAIVGLSHLIAFAAQRGGSAPPVVSDEQLTAMTCYRDEYGI
jgi:orotate phosphoribosyltransferase